jgi:hypothetical protein
VDNVSHESSTTKILLQAFNKPPATQKVPLPRKPELQEHVPSALQIAFASHSLKSALLRPHAVFGVGAHALFVSPVDSPMLKTTIITVTGTHQRQQSSPSQEAIINATATTNTTRKPTEKPATCAWDMLEFFVTQTRLSKSGTG